LFSPHVTCMKLFLLIFFSPLTCLAQDITGIWSGHLHTGGNELPYELAISRTNDKYSGYSLTVFIIDGIENTGMKSMKIKFKNGKATIEDDELIQDDYSIKPKRMMLFATLTLSGKDSSLILSGPFNTRSYNNVPYKGTLILRKKNIKQPSQLLAQLNKLNKSESLSFIQTQKPPNKQTDIAVNKITPAVKVKEKEKINASSPTAKKDPAPTRGNQFEVHIPPPGTRAAADLSKRKIETLQTLAYTSDSLLLYLYDNGQVDGDTVSIVLNGQTILERRGLTERPITYTIYTQRGTPDSLQLVMYAENLGTLPPNTGLLVILDGSVRHEVRFSGDLQRNSAIILKRRR
jgi:hypothetical protein